MKVFTLNKVVPRYRTGSSGWVESYEVLGIFSTCEKAHEEKKRIFVEAVLSGFENMQGALSLSKEDAHTLKEWNVGGRISDNLEEMMQILYLLFPQKIVEANTKYQKEELELQDDEVKELTDIQKDFEYELFEDEIFDFLVQDYKDYSAMANVFESIAKMISVVDKNTLDLHRDKLVELIGQIFENMEENEKVGNLSEVLCVFEYNLDEKVKPLY